MATRCFNVVVPFPLLRLGEGVVEDLVHLSINRDINAEDVRISLERHVAVSKRASREMLKPITDSDCLELNTAVSKVRPHVDPGERLRIRAFYNRGLCQIFKLAVRQ